MDIQTLKSETRFANLCPAFILNDNGDPIRCNENLLVLHTHNIVGDDYGSWSEHQFSFVCGHTFADMAAAERYADQI